MNIYLIGMMGSGKSVTGKKLAALLGCSFVDLDQWIEDRHHRSINELFEKEGEVFFRTAEAGILKEACGSGPRVVATGGGTILHPENVERMRATGKIVFLQTSPDMLWERVKHKKDRPLLKGVDPRENLMRIFKDRQSRYEQASDLQINTDGQTAEAVAQKIMEELQKSS